MRVRVVHYLMPTHNLCIVTRVWHQKGFTRVWSVIITAGVALETHTIFGLPHMSEAIIFSPTPTSFVKHVSLWRSNSFSCHHSATTMAAKRASIRPTKLQTCEFNVNSKPPTNQSNTFLSLYPNTRTTLSVRESLDIGPNFDLVPKIKGGGKSWQL